MCQSPLRYRKHRVPNIDFIHNMSATRSKSKPRRQVRFPGLVTDAEALGVHRNHLYLVLSGRRVSKSLTNRYRALKKGDVR